MKIAAVVGVPHPEMGRAPGAGDRAARRRRSSRKAKCCDYLAPRIVKWWMPDDVVFDAVPLTATGKIDKKVLRDAYKDHLMEKA